MFNQQVYLEPHRVRGCKRWGLKTPETGLISAFEKTQEQTNNKRSISATPSPITPALFSASFSSTIWCALCFTILLSVSLQLECRLWEGGIWGQDAWLNPQFFNTAHHAEGSNIHAEWMKHNMMFAISEKWTKSYRIPGIPMELRVIVCVCVCVCTCVHKNQIQREIWCFWNDAGKISIHSEEAWSSGAGLERYKGGRFVTFLPCQLKKKTY